MQLETCWKQQKTNEEKEVSGQRDQYTQANFDGLECCETGYSGILHLLKCPRIFVVKFPVLESLRK